MVLFGLKWFVEATCAVCGSLRFPTAISEGIVSVKRTDSELKMLAEHLDSGDFPKTWSAAAPSG
jgi:hypothetical protein